MTVSVIMQVTLVYQKGSVETNGFDSSCGTDVRVFSTEKDLLQNWLELTRDYDPDSFVTFQVAMHVSDK